MRAFCHFSSCLVYVVILAFVAISFSKALFAQEASSVPGAGVAPRPLITQPVDETQMTVLKGNTHRLARPEFDLGTAPATLPMQRMLLVLKRSPEQESALRKLLDDQQDKASASYHKWLTPEQFGQQFGPTDSDMQTITSWLQSHGFQVGSTKGRTVLEFSGSASQVKETFHTSIHRYLVNGEQHWANASDPSIPTALTPAVAGVLTLHNFVKKPDYWLAKQRIHFSPGHLAEATVGSGINALGPGDYAVIYNMNPVYNPPATLNGNGITIAVIGRSDIQISDVTDFQSLFGLSANVPTIIVNGPDPGDVPGDDLEGTLDVTWSQALAPGAAVEFVNSATTNNTDGTILSELYIVENNLGSLMSESFGLCEAEDTGATGESLLSEQAAAQGITHVASAGDAGAEGCDDPNSETVATGPISVNVPASTPFTVAVGGTMFNENGDNAKYWSGSTTSAITALSYIPEDAWNESCSTTCAAGATANIGAGGGGVSQLFAQPSWQSGVTGLTSITPSGFRAVPDVSLTAAGHDGYILCFQGSCSGSQPEVYLIGGTSASAPSFAAILALVYEKMSQVEGLSGARQGQADYVLYPLAVAENANLSQCNGSNTTTPPSLSTCVFNDVTVGNNDVPGEAGYPSGPYNTAVGYDAATGLGSVNVANLVSAWATATFRATTSTLLLNGATTLVTTTHGHSVNVGITVAPSSGTGTPTGDVSLIAATTSGSQGVPPAGFEQPAFTLSGGSVAASTTQLPGGSYTVTAHYAGNGTFAPSDSSPGIPVTVSAESSTTAVSAADQNNNPIVGGTLPFGSLVFVRADVAGNTGQGIPTGMLTFVDTFGTLPGPIFNPVANPVALNSQGNTSIGAGVINFDAGNHSISASYAGDSSFSPSTSGAPPVTFTIQPGFAGISGPTNVTITTPGMSGTTTVSFIASSNFTTALSFSCAGLPAEATCTSTPVAGSGPNTPVNVNITVMTTAPHLTLLQPNHRQYYLAAIFGGGMPLAGVLFFATPRRRGWAALLGLMLLLLVMLPACGGGSGSGGGGGGQQHQDPGTPAGTYTITLTATAGSLSAQAAFSLVVN